jgi:hypothetical protein
MWLANRPCRKATRRLCGTHADHARPRNPAFQHTADHPDSKQRVDVGLSLHKFPWRRIQRRKLWVDYQGVRAISLLHVVGAPIAVREYIKNQSATEILPCAKFMATEEDEVGSLSWPARHRILGAAASSQRGSLRFHRNYTPCKL